MGKIKITCKIKKTTAEALIIHDNVCMQKGINKNTPTTSTGTSSRVCTEHCTGLLEAVDHWRAFFCRCVCMTHC